MELESEAKLQGWVPREEFKGKAEKWVDAETYVERGREIMPILQSNNKRLLSELESVKSVVESLKDTVNTQHQSMEELKVFHQESSKAQVEKARKDLLAELKAAKADGDIDQEIQLTADLSKFDAAQVAAKQEKTQVSAPVTTPAAPRIDPLVEDWMSVNPWYGTDLEKTGLMDGVTKRMRQEGSPLFGTAFLEAAGAIVAERFNEKIVSKVDGGGRNMASSSANSASYANLPADARDICDRQASRFVGPDKVYKTKKEWQDFYVAEYNKGN